MSSIMLNDLARMARDGSAPLIGRPITEPSALERANFMLTHNNMTPEQWQESQRQLQREAIEDKILMEYRGEIPGNVVADVRGLRGARCEWVRFKAWLARTTAELSELESTKARLSDIMSAPDKTAGVIGALISRTAAFLLGKGGADDDATERLELDKKLAAERHRSQAAAEALPEIERQIEVKQMQVEALQSREGEFLNPAMQDLLEASGVAKLLARRRAEVLALESIIRDCDRDFPWDYYNDHRPKHSEVCDIEWRHTWRDVAGALRSDPRAEVGKLLPKIKA